MVHVRCVITIMRGMRVPRRAAGLLGGMLLLVVVRAEPPADDEDDALHGALFFDGLMAYVKCLAQTLAHLSAHAQLIHIPTAG